MAETTLTSLLLEIGSALDALTELAERKSVVVSDGDTRALDGIVRTEEELSRKIADLEEKRIQIAAESFSESPAESSEIEKLRLSLCGKAEKLKVLNERNQRLIRQGLDLVEFQLKLFMPKPLYKGASRPGPMLVDFRV